jgi:hypothetical protein
VFVEGPPQRAHSERFPLLCSSEHAISPKLVLLGAGVASRTLVAFSHHLSEAAQIRFPGTSLCLDPVLQDVQTALVDPAKPDSPAFLGDDKLAGFQNGDVLSDRSLGHFQHSGKIGNGSGRLSEKTYQGTPRPIPKRVEDMIYLCRPFPFRHY